MKWLKRVRTGVDWMGRPQKPQVGVTPYKLYLVEKETDKTYRIVKDNGVAVNVPKASSSWEVVNDEVVEKDS